MGELSLLLDRLRADLEPSRDTSSHGDSAGETGSCGGGALMRMRAPRHLVLVHVQHVELDTT